MNSRRRIASPPGYTTVELQQGFGINGMGQRDPFATQQFPAAHVRFGSKADIPSMEPMSALPPKATVCCNAAK
jgi:hypothetical protein